MVMYPAILIFGVGALVLSQTHHGFTLVVASILIGLGLGTLQSSCQTIAVKVVPSQRTGLATSTFLMFIGCCSGNRSDYFRVYGSTNRLQRSVCRCSYHGISLPVFILSITREEGCSLQTPGKAQGLIK